MSASIFPDPLQLWRDAIDRLEKDSNTAATESLRSPELMRSLQQGSTTLQGMQRAFEKATEAHLRRVSLPSRSEVQALAEALERIEEKIDRLLPQASPAPRPARTRQPSSSVPVAPPVVVPVAKPPRRPAAAASGRRAPRVKKA